MTFKFSHPEREFFKMNGSSQVQNRVKKVPAWASDEQLLQRVVTLQYAQMRRQMLSMCPELQNCKNIAGRQHPITFSWHRFEQQLRPGSVSKKHRIA